MKELIKRRSLGRQPGVASSDFPIDEEDLAVLNQNITVLNQAKDETEWELEDDKERLGTVLASMKASNDVLMAKFDESGKHLKKYLILMKEFKRFKKLESVKRRDEQKVETKRLEDQNFLKLKERMIQEKQKRRKNQIYGGLDHLSDDKRARIVNDGETELFRNDEKVAEMSGEYLFTVSQDRH